MGKNWTSYVAKDPYCYSSSRTPAQHCGTIEQVILLSFLERSLLTRQVLPLLAKHLHYSQLPLLQDLKLESTKVNRVPLLQG